MSASAPDPPPVIHRPKSSSPASTAVMANSGRSNTPPPARAQLAAVLAETTQELESLRSRLNEAERRASHFEALYKSLKDGSSEDAIRVLEQRVYDAERRRDDEIAKRGRIGQLWFQFRDQLRMMESQSAEARAAMDRAMESPTLSYHPPSSSRVRSREDERDDYPPSKRSRTVHSQPTVRVDTQTPHHYPRSRSSSNASSKSIDDALLRAAGATSSENPYPVLESASHHRSKHAPPGHHANPSLSPPLHRHTIPASAYPQGYSYPQVPPNSYPPYGAATPNSARPMKPYGHWDASPSRSGSGQQHNHHRPWPPSDDSHRDQQTHVFVSAAPVKKAHADHAPAVAPDSSSFYPPVNAQGQRICRQCGQPGRYKEGKCVEKWGPGPMGSGTVCDRCRKKMKRVERRSTLETLQQQQGKAAPQPQLTPSQAQSLGLAQPHTHPESPHDYPPSMQRPPQTPTSALPHGHAYPSHPSSGSGTPHDPRGRTKPNVIRPSNRPYNASSRPGQQDEETNERDELASAKDSDQDADGDGDAEMDVDGERDREQAKSPSSDHYGDSYAFGRAKAGEPKYAYPPSQERERPRYPDKTTPDEERRSGSSAGSDRAREREGDPAPRFTSLSPPIKTLEDDRPKEDNDDDADGDGIDNELMMAVEAAEAKSTGSSSDHGQSKP